MLLTLYCGWMGFWVTFSLGAYLLPREHAKTRPAAKITDKKVAERVAINCVASAALIPITSFIPELIHFPMYLSPIKYVTAVVIADLWFYHLHRLFHHPLLYRWHTDHHAFISPHALGALYCSVVEMVLINQLSVSIPMRILDFSPWELLFANVLLALNTLKGHAGIQYYDGYPWLNWIGFTNEVHDEHHRILNRNYGASYVFDWLYGTM